MSKWVVDYCWTCARRTKQEVIQCKDSVPFRIFENICTLGLASLMERKYDCQCTKCGNVNTVYK